MSKLSNCDKSKQSNSFLHDGSWMDCKWPRIRNAVAWWHQEHQQEVSSEWCSILMAATANMLWQSRCIEKWFRFRNTRTEVARCPKQKRESSVCCAAFQHWEFWNWRWWFFGSALNRSRCWSMLIKQSQGQQVALEAGRGHGFGSLWRLAPFF